MCFLRIAEMAGGWGNHIMQDEISFLILDSTLILVATYLLTIFHPGLFFPQMRNGYRKGGADDDLSKESAGDTTTTAESGNEAGVVGVETEMK